MLAQAPSAVQVLAEWVARPSASYGETAVARVKQAVIDTIACMCVGSDKPPARAARQAVSNWGSGRSVVIATEHRLAPPWAALANGAAAHALDFDDWEMPANAHPSAVMVPALFALGDEIDADGKQLIDAYITGFEVIVRVGEAANMEFYNKGWHPTATIAAFGAAAACARLLRLDRKACAASLGIVSSMVAGYQSQAGTMTKPIHAGLAAKNGILAAQLAVSGATSADHALDGTAGFIAIHAGKDASAFDGPLRKLGRPLGIEEYGLVTKRYPSCGYTHRAVDGVLELRQQHGIKSEDVAGVIVKVPQHFTNALRYGMPNDEREALFSMPYCVAAALHGGKLGLADFTPEAVARKPVRSLVSLIDVQPYLPTEPTQNMGPADPDIVQIRLRNGRTVETKVDYPVGTIFRPMPTADLETKFRECTTGLLTEGEATRVLETVRKLDSLNSIRKLTLQLVREPAQSLRRATART